MAELHILQEPGRATPDAIPGRPLWRLGFRPFFLFGAGFGLLGVGLWIAVYAGWLSPAPEREPLGGWLGWHRHEMPFGFASAIVAGFLLTAIQNWTSRPSLHGRPLLGLFALWLAARLCWLLGVPWQWTLVPELAFFLLLAFAAGRLLWKVRQSHNYLIPITLVAMGLADAETLAGIATGNDAWQYNGALAVVWLIVALMTMIGGRVIPFFTQRGLGRPQPGTGPLWLDVVLMTAALAAAVFAASGLDVAPHGPFAVFFAALAVGHAFRLGCWYDRGIWNVALLWPLHVACLWLVVAFAGLVLYHAGTLPSASFALHALTVGAMGGLILAMIARVSLGHTGRPLQASQGITWAFVLLNLGALARVFLASWFLLPGLILSTVCWVVAFGLFVAIYTPVLCRARADGKPG
ncbi:MAG: NnrS family protein [Azoarcus sp.]|jgi:uncharacterized protein involved in response to NO|nr:NnrS family protein [Azoarcus sp.]